MLAGVLAAALASMALVASSAQAEFGHDTPEFTCTSVTINYFGFGSGEAVTVKEKIRVSSEVGTFYYVSIFKFTGPTASHVIPVTVPPGFSEMDAFVKWKSANFKGHSDQRLAGKIHCEPDPKYTIVKKQRLAGTLSYSTATIPNGKVGEKVEYGIVVTNTGNVPLELSNFSDPNCDEGTLTGPGQNPIPIKSFTNFFCSHTLTEADHTVGIWCNIAGVTATPTEGPSEAITQESNEVCTELPTPKTKRGFSCEGITFYFEGFPNMPGNTVRMRIRVDGVFTPPKPEFVYYTFTGPTGSYTFPLNLSPGHHSLDGFVAWNTNGFKGSSDIAGGVNCPET